MNSVFGNGIKKKALLQDRINNGEDKIPPSQREGQPNRIFTGNKHRRQHRNEIRDVGDKLLQLPK